jgi:hypothetical protein
MNTSTPHGCGEGALLNFVIRLRSGSCLIRALGRSGRDVWPCVVGLWACVSIVIDNTNRFQRIEAITISKV